MDVDDGDDDGDDADDADYDVDGKKGGRCGNEGAK